MKIAQCGDTSLIPPTTSVCSYLTFLQNKQRKKIPIFTSFLLFLRHADNNWRGEAASPAVPPRLRRQHQQQQQQQQQRLQQQHRRAEKTIPTTKRERPRQLRSEPQAAARDAVTVIIINNILFIIFFVFSSKLQQALCILGSVAAAAATVRTQDRGRWVTVSPKWSERVFFLPPSFLYSFLSWLKKQVVHGFKKEKKTLTEGEVTVFGH